MKKKERKRKRKRKKGKIIYLIICCFLFYPPTTPLNSARGDFLTIKWKMEKGTKIINNKENGTQGEVPRH